MPEPIWEIVAEVYGDLKAELLRGLLEAEGIPVTLNQEGAGRAVGLQIGSLGEVKVLVPSNSIDSARKVVQDYYAGAYDVETNEKGKEDKQES